MISNLSLCMTHVSSDLHVGHVWHSGDLPFALALQSGRAVLSRLRIGAGGVGAGRRKVGITTVGGTLFRPVVQGPPVLTHFHVLSMWGFSEDIGQPIRDMFQT